MGIGERGEGEGKGGTDKGDELDTTDELEATSSKGKRWLEHYNSSILEPYRICDANFSLMRSPKWEIQMLQHWVSGVSVIIFRV